jgi:hypothetical protein
MTAPDKTSIRVVLAGRPELGTHRHPARIARCLHPRCPCSLLTGREEDRLRQRPGNDQINGGPGTDTLIGGTGNDWINAKDGAADHINGGPGTDRALVDPTLDTVISVEKYNKR